MSILDLKVFLRCRFQVETTWGFCARMGFVPSIRAKLALEDCGNMQGAQKMSGSRYWRFWTGLLKLYFGKGTWITPSDASTAPVGLGQSSQAQEPSTWRSHWHRTEEVWIVFHYDSWETLTPWLPISFTIPIAPRLPNHWTVHPSTWQHQQTCLGTQILGADELVDGAQLDGD